MKNNLQILVSAGQKKERLDRYLTNRIENATRTKVQVAIKKKEILVNGKFVKSSYNILPGDLIIINIDKGEPPEVLAENIPLEIFFEDQDLIIVGEYMGVEIFENTKGVFSKINSSLHSKKGWWNTLKIEDLNNDGYPDLIIGNHGLNSKFKASDEFPIQLFTNDFDDNGFSESIICFKEDNGKMYPFALRHDLIEQIKSLKKKFPDYESFKNADLEKIIDEKKLKESHISEVNYLETSIFLNKGNFEFEKVNMPKEVQFSPVYAIETHDFDNDGDIDIIMGGNLYGVKPEFGIYDASFGIYLENLGGNKFKYVQDGKGFFVEGQIRDIKIFKDHVYVAKNNSETEVFQIKLNDK